MKLTTLLSAATLGLAAPTQAQNLPVPQGDPAASGREIRPPVQLPQQGAGDLAGERERPLDAVILKAGSLAEVVTQMEQQVEGNGFLPNILFDTNVRDAVVPGDLTLRRVTPVQALALVAAAAGCSLEPIVAPAEPGGGAQTQGLYLAPNLPVIGYRFARASGPNGLPSPVIPQLAALESGEGANTFSGVGMVLTEKDDKIVVQKVVPGSPAAHYPVIKRGQRILSVEEAGKEEVDVSGKGLQEVVQLLRGEVGTTVKVGLVSDMGKNPVKEMVSLVRAKLPTLALGEDLQVRVVEQSPAEAHWMNREIVADPPIKPADNSQLVTKVYALGSILSGSDEEADQKHLQCQELIALTLQQAELNAKVSPDLSFHRNARVLVVKATAAQQEMIGQVIKALKENETPAAPPALKR